MPMEPDRPKSWGCSSEKTTINSACPSPMFSRACSAPEGTKNICPVEIVKLECWLESAKMVTKSSPPKQ
jgi:hypothetical protein